MLLFVLVGLLIVVDLPVIVSSSKGDRPTDTPDLRTDFLSTCFTGSKSAFLGSTSLEGGSGRVCDYVVLLVNIWSRELGKTK